jgi:hypothetical protein
MVVGPIRRRLCSPDVAFGAVSFNSSPSGYGFPTQSHKHLIEMPRAKHLAPLIEPPATPPVFLPHNVTEIFGLPDPSGCFTIGIRRYSGEIGVVFVDGCRRGYAILDDRLLKVAQGRNRRLTQVSHFADAHMPRTYRSTRIVIRNRPAD